jgi:hypothetical protein
MNNESVEEIDEMDFSSMASQLKKYGGKENVKDGVKGAQSRSKYAPDYTMTGHKEKVTSTGRQYSKVLPDYDDEDDVKAAKKSVTTGATPQEKRGRGRPKGVGAKAGQYKPRDPAKKAESAAKAAATKAANKAKKAALTNEDCEEIFEGLTFDDMIEFMIDEEVVALDELNKSTLGSYIKKATMDLGSKFYDSGRDEGKDKKSSYYNFRSAEKRQRGINKAVGKLATESAENLEEMIDKDVQSLDETSEIKVGSIVTPKIGPHAGKPHTVIHVHENGTFNIKPNIDVRKVKYHLGAARCSRTDLKESHKDEFSLEELALFIESEEFNSLDENELALFEGIFNESSDAVVKDKSGKVIKFKHTGDWEKKKEDPIVDKSGAKHTAHSRVRDLARNAIKRVGKSEISFAKNESEESLSKEVKVPHDGAMNPTKIHMSHVDDLVKSGKYKYFSAHGAPGYPASILRHVASGKKVNISTGNRDHSTFTHVHRVLESEKTGTKPAITTSIPRRWIS